MQNANKKALLLLLAMLFSGLAYSGFLLESVNINVRGISEDGSASVEESIKMIVDTDNSRTLYNSLFNANDLSTWASATGLSEMRTHTNRRFVDVSNFRVMPQKLTRCSALSDTCHGEVILSYRASPYYQNGTVVSATGLFSADKYKPRTVRYGFNQNSLDLRKTEKGDIIIDSKIFLNFLLPKDSSLVEVNPKPDNADYISSKELSWSDTILVNFVLMFEVEKSIDTEVFDFFSSIPKGIASMIVGDQGPAVVLVVLILLGSYIYLRSVSRNKAKAGGQ